MNVPAGSFRVPTIRRVVGAPHLDAVGDQQASQPHHTSRVAACGQQVAAHRRPARPRRECPAAEGDEVAQDALAVSSPRSRVVIAAVK